MNLATVMATLPASAAYTTRVEPSAGRLRPVRILEPHGPCRFYRALGAAAGSRPRGIWRRVAPLILLALMWLLAESTRSPAARMRPRRARDAITTLIRT